MLVLVIVRRGQKSGAVQWIPDGVPGTRVTLAMMRDLARAGASDPMVRAKAMQVIQQARVAPTSLAALKALHAFVCNQVRYVSDDAAMKRLFPRVAARHRGVELLSTPRATLQKGYEDCDGKATLLAAMVQSIGHPAKVGFRAITATASMPDVYTHVYNFARLMGITIPMDATYPGTRFGWEYSQGIGKRVAA